MRKPRTYAELYWGTVRAYLPSGSIPNVFLDEEEDYDPYVTKVMRLRYYPEMLKTPLHAYLPLEIDGIIIYVTRF